MAQNFNSINELLHWCNENKKTDCIEYLRYSTVKYKDQNYRPCDLAWILSHDKIPNNKYVAHTCKHLKCCNPEHLKLVLKTEFHVYGN